MRVVLLAALSALAVLLILFYAEGMGHRHQHCMTLEHACQGACERLGSEMENQYDNTCVCANMMVMRGDYGQMFLQGRQVR